MDLCIQTNDLHFSFGSSPVLKGLDLAVPLGSIYGFLGPNGAGKSTTIKILLGLLRCKPGQVRLFDEDIRKQRLPILSRVGNLIEAPSVYQHLSARQHLQYLDTIFPMGKARIDEVLELVGLQAAARKKIRHFSMGMKQRLGIATALFHDPELLILDEPVNGLDPAGIQEMRQLFLHLREQGKTLFISSHILDEIEKTVSHLAIIKQGELVFQGELQELRSSTQRLVQLRTDSAERALAFASDLGYASEQVDGQQIRLRVEHDEAFDQLLREAVRREVPIYDVQREAPNLEQLFIDLTKN